MKGVFSLALHPTWTDGSHKATFHLRPFAEQQCGHKQRCVIEAVTAEQQGTAHELIKLSVINSWLIRSVWGSGMMVLRVSVGDVNLTSISQFSSSQSIMGCRLISKVQFLKVKLCRPSWNYLSLFFKCFLDFLYFLIITPAVFLPPSLPSSISSFVTLFDPFYISLMSPIIPPLCLSLSPRYILSA